MLKKLAAALSVTAVLAATPALADHRHHGRHHRSDNSGALLALGAIAGFALGAAVLGSQQAEPPVAYAPAPYPPPAPPAGYYVPSYSAPRYYGTGYYAPGYYYAPGFGGQDFSR